MEEELPSGSDVAKVDNKELKKITENTVRGMEDLIAQLDNPLGDSFEHPLQEFLGLDKELRSVGSLLKVETARKVQLEECIEREKRKLSEI